MKTWVTNMSAPAFNNRFVQFLINPNGQAGKKSEHSCFVTTRKLVPLDAAGNPPLGRAERTGTAAGHSPPLGASGTLYTALCEFDGLDQGGHRS